MEDWEKSFDQIRPELDTAWKTWAQTPKRNKAAYEDALNAFTALSTSWVHGDRQRKQIVADYIAAKLARTYGGKR